MSIKYKVAAKRPGGMAGEREPRFYPVLTNRKAADLNMICELISSRCTLHQADVKAVVESLIGIIPELLRDGYNPRLDDFGTFSVHVSSKGKDQKEKVTKLDIDNIKMAFLPSKRLKAELKKFDFVKE